MPKPLPLASARFLSTIAAPLRDCGAPVEKYLERCAIPIDGLEMPKAVVSELALWEFENRAALAEGHENLGYIAAISTKDLDHGHYCGVPIPHSEHLYDRLDILSREISCHSNYANHDLCWVKGGAWYTFDNRKLVAELPWQVEQFIIGMIVAIIRDSIPFWRPSFLILNNKKGRYNIPEDWQGTDIAWSRPNTGVFVENSVLFTKCRRPNSNVIQESNDVRSNDAMIALLRAYILSNSAELETVARSFHMTPRSFQRALAARGQHFRSIKKVAIMKLARRLLDETEHSVGDIAIRLGYNGHPDFTKAFKRYFGQPPSEMRSSREKLSQKRF